LRVPTGTKAKYEVANVWKDFSPIVEYNTTGIEPIDAQTLKAYASDGILYISGLPAGQTWQVHSITGTLIDQGIADRGGTQTLPIPARGIYLVTDGHTTVKVVN